MTIAIKTADQLIASSEFTFGELVQAFNWNVKDAVDYVETLCERSIFLSMYQDEDENEVWDGGLGLNGNGVPIYVGNSQPSGCGELRVRLVRANDKFEAIDMSC